MMPGMVEKQKDEFHSSGVVRSLKTLGAVVLCIVAMPLYQLHIVVGIIFWLVGVALLIWGIVMSAREVKHHHQLLFGVANLAMKAFLLIAAILSFVFFNIVFFGSH